MDIEGEVPRDEVLQVLRENGVHVTFTPDGYVLEKSALCVLEMQVVPELVGRKMLKYLSRKFEIAVHLFFHAGSAN